MSTFEKSYSRFSNILLPYNLDYMAVEKELIMDYIDAILFYKYKGEIVPLTDNIMEEHIMDDFSNPHRVTKEQVGLGRVLNAQAVSFEDFTKHIMDFNNPHKVTARQLGLEFIGNIQFASDDDMKQLKKMVEELEERINFIKYRISQIQYTLLMKTTPKIPVVIRIFYDNKWVYGSMHSLPNGTYKYEIFPITGKKKLTIDSPINSTIEVIDDKGESSIGKIHFLDKGNYIVKVSLKTYKPYIEYVTIDNEDVHVEVKSMLLEEYPVKIYTAPEECTVSVEYKGHVLNNKEIKLPVGEYYVTASAPGFVAQKQKFRVTDSNENFAVVKLKRKKYPVKINIIPSDAEVYVSNRDYIKDGHDFALYEDKYTLVAMRNGYNTLRRSIIVEDIEGIQSFDIRLNPISYKVDILTLQNNTNIEIYDKMMNLVSKNRKSVVLDYGYYYVKASCTGYETASIPIFVDDDKSVVVDLNKIKYTLTFNTEPKNTTIKLYKDDILVEGNKEYRVLKGIYKYIAEHNGYISESKDIYIDNNREINIDLKLAHTIKIVSQPEGAKIKLLINEDYESSTNNIFIVSSGVYQVYAELDGYLPNNTGITVDGSGTHVIKMIEKKLNLIVRPKDKSFGDYFVRIRGKNVERGGERIYSLDSGTYEVYVSSYGYVDYITTVTLDKEDVVLEFEMIPLTRYDVNITTIPDNVRILTENIKDTDRKAIGKNIQLLPGEYATIVSADGYITQIKRFKVIDRNIDLNINLIPSI